MIDEGRAVFLYQSRVRGYSLLDGALVSNMAVRHAPERRYMGRDFTQKFQNSMQSLGNNSLIRNPFQFSQVSPLSINLAKKENTFIYATNKSIQLTELMYEMEANEYMESVAENLHNKLD